ncbi:MAG: HAMP domain-containing histidine kinase [Lachnospiraceae bacterium]|nr:HAMP domain-containing histidine kinase [Lachnospiraceae bacterium]
MKRRIIVSNILLICIPVLLALLLWGMYVGSHHGMYMNPLKEDSKQGTGMVYNMQYMLYLYENVLAGLDFDEGFQSGDGDPDIYPSEQMRRIEELSEMGFHLETAEGDRLLYSNMDDEDSSFLREHIGRNENATESLDYYGDDIVMHHVVIQKGREYSVTAVYRSERVNNEMLESLLPVYLVAPQIMVVFLIIVAAGILIMAYLMTRWLSRSVLKPLDIMVSATKEIADGKLDTPVSYAGKDEFGTVIREFDHMRVELKAARDQQEQLEEVKRDFMVGVSHDLRSPMTSIRGYAEGLRDGIADTDEKKQRYYAAILTRTSDMERLLTSLSGLLRVENKNYRLQTEKVHMDEFVKQFIQEEKIYEEQNSVTIRYQNSANALEAELDVQEMRRVFINLLDNSVKYRIKDESRISITVGRSCDGHSVEIRFADDGPGVPEEQLSRLFDSFYRGDASRTRPETGSGLGLAVVKGIIEAHGGTVQAFNRHGLEILIALPVYQKKGTTHNE